MSQEPNMSSYSNYPDVDKEYDFEAEHDRFNIERRIMEMKKFEEEQKALRFELRAMELERQREIYSQEDDLIERVMHIFRGRRISQRAYDIITNELRFCVEDMVREEYLHRNKWEFEQIKKMAIEYQQQLLQPRMTFRWDSDSKEDAKEKDFIGEDDMKL